MKRNVFVVLIAAILVCALAAGAWATEPVKLVVNGQEIKPDVSPQIIGGRTMVPVRWVAEALGAKVEWDAQTKTVIITTDTPTIYKNMQYGFSFQLPESWKGYMIISDQWEGIAVETPSNVPAETGPLFSIRNPRWTAEKPYQDIPIMIFTHMQWNALQKSEFSVGAAPVPPGELGRNSQYVFALPARYNFAFPTGYEEVAQILAGAPLKPLVNSVLAPDLAEKIIKDHADQLIYALKVKDATAIAAFVHPAKGVRFTPYTYVQPEIDQVLSSEDLRSLFEDEKVYLWGHYDGSGHDIKLTPGQYYEKFVYAQDYINAEKIGYNQVLSSGNMLENQFEVYDDPIVVEYYFSGFNPDYAGMDWRSLRLVFEPWENDWKLVGIINNQWTI